MGVFIDCRLRHGVETFPLRTHCEARKFRSVTVRGLHCQVLLHRIHILRLQVESG